MYIIEYIIIQVLLIVWFVYTIKNPTKKESPLWLSILCVMAFILAGFNHCIADWFYVFGSFDPIKYLYWFLIVIGNFLGGYLAATK